MLCSDGNEVFTPSNLPSAAGQLPRKLSALLQSLVLVHDSGIAPETCGFLGDSKEVPGSWVAATCPPRSSGDKDELLEAGLIFAEAPTARGEICVHV